MLVDYGNRIDEGLNRHVLGMSAALDHEAVIETIPAYSSILVEYDCSIAPRSEMERLVRETMPLDIRSEPVLHEIYVSYGGDDGPDLRYVAHRAGLSEHEVVRIHTSREYRVYMLGFLPGFCYLGGMDEAISTPRLDTPKVKIPAGSVGIAGSQTGIYPSNSPGGWRIIGRTGFRLYRPEEDEPFPVKPGDYIRFVDEDI